MAKFPLLLEYEAESVPEGGVTILASPAPVVKASWKDPAGHAFHKMAMRQLGLLEDSTDDDAAATGDEDEPSSEVEEAQGVDYGEPEGPWKSKGKKKKKKKGGKKKGEKKKVPK
mmetsp:Transcript_36419/g.86495  ORF Transcript_36419/g.86495 Transcript_36419/m.86495 type:complete len:114 (+) Transcript_36419:37-378(+)